VLRIGPRVCRNFGGPPPLQIDWAFGLRYSRLNAQQHPLHAEILRAGAIFAKILSPQLTRELRLLLLSRLRRAESPT
jgi:hypothetical protein